MKYIYLKEHKAKKEVQTRKVLTVMLGMLSTTKKFNKVKNKFST